VKETPKEKAITQPQQTKPSDTKKVIAIKQYDPKHKEKEEKRKRLKTLKSTIVAMTYTGVETIVAKKISEIRSKAKKIMDRQIEEFDSHLQERILESLRSYNQHESDLPKINEEFKRRCKQLESQIDEFIQAPEINEKTIKLIERKFNIEKLRAKAGLPISYIHRNS